jgi:protocatechuate 3,4-dioxygenase beta subunit
LRRRDLVGAVAAAAAALGGALALLPRSSSPPPAATPPGLTRPGATATAPADSPDPESSTIAGRVVDPRGAPVAGAEVLLGESRASMADEACDCPTCREKLLEDSCPAAEAKIAELVGRREGEWLPDRSTRTDASGAFAFPGAPTRPNLLLWASAPGFSPALRQRVLPEESAVLVLGIPFSVAGRVVDEENHPIASALVTAIPSIVPRFVEATTGADGTFRIEGLGPGSLYLLASAPRYLPRGAPLPRPGPPALTLALARPRALEVVVKDRGAPALGASARLYTEHRIIPLAPAAGCFRAENLAPGAYMVSASRGARSAHRRVTLGPGTTRVELSLEQGLSVRGRVLDDSGAGLAGAAIIASLDGRRIADARAGEGGRFALDGLPSGAALTASLEGYEPSTAPAAEGSDVELVLRPRAFVSGVVLTADGAPALGVQVLARGDGRGVATTGAGGEFRIALRAPGPVTLVAHHSVYGAGELSLEAPAADVQLRLSPLGSLRARLVDRAHRPIAGGTATAFREPGGLRDALSSDSPSREDGVIALAGLSPGTYRVRFTADGFQGAERPGVAVPKTGEVDLGDVELEAGLEIQGVVLQDDGSPAAGAFVHARAKGRREADGVAAGGDGTFALRGLKAGGYTVSAFLDKSSGEVLASAGDRGVVLRLQGPSRLRGRVVDEEGRGLTRFAVDGEPLEAADGRFDVAAHAVMGQVFFRVGAPGHLSEFRQAGLGPGSVAEAGDIVLARARSLEGIVQDEAGAPVAGALVTAQDRGELGARDEGAAGAVSRTDGRFRLEGLAPGHIALTARRGSLVTEAEVEVPDAEGAPAAVLTLQSTGAIEGALRGPEGRPMIGEVQVGDASASTDSAGRYHLGGLVPGPTGVLALFEGGGSAARMVAVEAGKTARLDFDFAAGGTLRIAVAGGASGKVHLLRAGPGATDRRIAEVVRGEAAVAGLPGGRYSVFFMSERSMADGIVDVPAQGLAHLALSPRPVDEAQSSP